MAQNLAQNDTTIYQPNPAYVAPQQYMYAQPSFVAQPGYVTQPGYVAQPEMGFVFVAQPDQPQITMNVNMNADPNRFGPANGGITMNVGVP